MTTLHTNLSSLFGQRSLASAQSQLSQSVERLSSGLRINRAKDDNAGLGISQELQRQTRALEVSKRNANDGISMAQTAEGALSSVSDMLQRMKELTTQGANQSLSKEQRKFIAGEIVQLKGEINAVAERTRFNGTRLLTGDFSKMEKSIFQANLGEIQSEKYAVAANPTIKLGAKSTSTFADASVIELTYMDADDAQLGKYSFSNIDESVTLTRTYNGKTTSQTLRLTTAGAAGKNDVYVTPTLNESFTLNFEELGVSTTFKITALNAKRSAIDFANLVTSVGAVPSPPNTWRDVLGANFAAGDPTDPVTAIVTASGSTVKISTTTGLSTLSGYGASSTWTSGTLSTIAFTGTVSQVNAALATLQSKSPTGFGNVEIAITPQFTNSSFSNSAGSTSGTTTTYEGWQVSETRVILGQTVIAGKTSPVDPTISVVPGDPNLYTTATLSSQSYDHQISTTVFPVGDSGKSLRLFNDLNFNVGDGNSVHGPYVVSRDPVEILAGDKVSFDWRAVGGGDAFDVFAYIVRTGEDGTSGDGLTQIILNQTSTLAANSTNWATEEITINQTGFYKFVFVAGAHDATSGGALDASLYIDNVSVKPVNARPGTLKTTNIATGGTFTVDNALETTAVLTSGVGRFTADDGIYRLSANADAKTVTLNYYDEDGTTLLGSETIGQKEALGSERYRLLDFKELGVSLRVQNNSNEIIRFGDVKSGLASEVTVTQNKRGSLIGENGPVFQVGEDSRNQVALDVFRDIRMGGNQDNNDAGLFNDAAGSIYELEASNDPDFALFQSLENKIGGLIDAISARRSSYGTIQNRLTSALNNIDAQFNNLAQAKSQIQDTDFAWETARLTKLQIGQQAATAMLAQANAIPNVIMALIE